VSSQSSGREQASVNKDYCFRHAQMYEGWDCPLCAADKAGAPAPPGAAAGRAGRGTPSAGGDATDAAGIVTPQSRSASRDRSNEAQQLLEAGDPRQALETCERAIVLDPENLHAFVVAARAADRVGSFQQQDEFVEEGARLLRQPEYRRVAKWYLDLLKGARDAAMARPIVAAAVASGPWPAADVLALVRTLVSRGFPGEALRVLESVPVGQRSLAICAYGAQLTQRSFAINDPEVDAYLASVPVTRRADVLGEVRQLCDAAAFPVSTLLLIRDAVRARYRAWAPEIQQALEIEARRQLAERLAPDAVKVGGAFAVRVGAVALAVFIVLTLSFGGGAPLLLLGFVLAVGAAVGGFTYGREAEIRKRLVPLLPRRKEELSQRESDDWQLILDDGAAPFATPPAAVPPSEPAADACNGTP
jgi:hypothetical protein